jgi:TonB family protein
VNKSSAKQFSKPGISGARKSAPSLPWSIGPDGNSIAILTLVLWLTVSGVGALGFALHYERPRPAMPQEAPIFAQQLQVELTQEQLPPQDQEPVLEQPPEPTLAGPLTQPVIAQPIAVAVPSPAVAFPLPVEGPKRIVDVKGADYVLPPVTNKPPLAPAGPPAQPLVLGKGEGDQPKPAYPKTAERLKQEGTVLVRLTVGEDGRVLDAEAKIASPWPLLNQAALRTVRQQWHFSKGPIRVYEVGIRFELLK